jgi:hypothetical protein
VPRNAVLSVGYMWGQARDADLWDSCGARGRPRRLSQLDRQLPDRHPPEAIRVMHALLRVCLGRVAGQAMVVLGFGLRWRTSAEAVHEPAGVVPADPL